MEKIDLITAQKLIAKALEKAAADYGKPICAAVCNENGDLIAFAWGDGAPLRSIKISQGKAYSAARLQRNTDAFLELLQNERVQTSDFCDDRLTALPGGAVVKDPGGKVLGGIGISGLAAKEDQAVADSVAKTPLSEN